jgi:hypothetical protein
VRDKRKSIEKKKREINNTKRKTNAKAEQIQRKEISKSFSLPFDRVQSFTPVTKFVKNFKF